MQAVEMEVTARLGMPEEAIKFSRQHLANSLWAMATLELLPSGRLLAAVAEAMKERASDCNPQEISNTVWAFAKLGENRKVCIVWHQQGKSRWVVCVWLASGSNWVSLSCCRPTRRMRLRMLVWPPPVNLPGETTDTVESCLFLLG